MASRHLLLPLLWLAACPSSAQEPASSTGPIRTLRQTYLSALNTSETIAISEQSVRQAEALYRLALGGSFPEFSLRSETAWQQRPINGRTSQSNGMIRVSQTGLTGYRELASLKTAKAVAGQRVYERRRVEQLLLRDIAAAFYGLLQARENVTSTQQLLELADRRLGELKERVRVGRTREADAIGQEFQSSALRSQLEEVARQVDGLNDLLGYLTRVSVQPEGSEDEVPADSRPLGDYLARVDSRPDVQAAREAVEAAVGDFRFSRADRLPQVGLQANYYGYRPVSQRNNKWDASFTVGLPIFSWGAVTASENASRAALTAQEYALQAARRGAEIDLRNAYRDNTSARRQLDIRRRAVELARRDYELQTRDERRGLVTSLEVLESLNRLNNARLNFNSALLDARLTALSLELAAGAKPEEILR